MGVSTAIGSMSVSRGLGIVAAMGLAWGATACTSMKTAAIAPQPETAETQLEGDRIPTEQGDLVVRPVDHASFVMDWQGKTIYVDPVGGSDRFAGLPAPDLILITHQHPDHLDVPTLTALGIDAPIVAPPSVAEMLPEGLSGRTQVVSNGEMATAAGIPIEAIPAYNTTAERLQYHPKGRDNGYILTLADTQVYIAGDTEDVPEMRALKGIDVAFVPMNLPYTMTVQQAADAVQAFEPEIVYPYHSRGSDTEEFARLVRESGADTKVRLRDWY